MEDLPELPAPSLETNGDVFGHENVSGFTAEQMREYARKAVLAERERCAVLCETLNHGAFGAQSYLSGIRDGSIGCAAAIRGDING